MNTTIENNKLIAEFMGLNLYRQNWYKSTIATEKKICEENDLLYHADWNWLMTVVQKIESLGYEVNIHGISCSVNKVLESEKIVHWVLGEKSRKIELVYTTVVSFIEQYNKNNTTNNSNI